MRRFQTFWIRMQKNEPLDESRETCQTSGTKMSFYSLQNFKVDKKHEDPVSNQNPLRF
ncbi:hypothetical protein Hanom_Chr17g01564811 [Helianthus anomalus]